MAGCDLIKGIPAQRLVVCRVGKAMGVEFVFLSRFVLHLKCWGADVATLDLSSSFIVKKEALGGEGTNNERWEKAEKQKKYRRNKNKRPLFACTVSFRYITLRTFYSTQTNTNQVKLDHDGGQSQLLKLSLRTARK